MTPPKARFDWLPVVTLAIFAAFIAAVWLQDHPLPFP